MRICVSLENTEKDRYGLIFALFDRCLNVPSQLLEHRIGSAIRIHHHPVNLRQRPNHLLELSPHLLLKRADLVSLLSESTSLLLLLRIQVQKEHNVGGGKTAIGSKAPIDVVSLRRRKCNSAGEVAVADNRDSVPQIIQDAVSRFPAVCGEKKVDTVVLYVALVLKILVDLLSDDRRPIFHWITPNNSLLGKP